MTYFDRTGQFRRTMTARPFRYSEHIAIRFVKRRSQTATTGESGPDQLILTLTAVTLDDAWMP